MSLKRVKYVQRPDGNQQGNLRLSLGHVTTSRNGRPEPSDNKGGDDDNSSDDEKFWIGQKPRMRLANGTQLDTPILLM